MSINSDWYEEQEGAYEDVNQYDKIKKNITSYKCKCSLTCMQNEISILITAWLQSLMSYSTARLKQQLNMSFWCHSCKELAAQNLFDIYWNALIITKSCHHKHANNIWSVFNKFPMNYDIIHSGTDTVYWIDICG